MKTLCTLITCCLLTTAALAKDKDKSENSSNPADALTVTGGGTFAKVKILSKMDKLSIAQYIVNFKQASTVAITKREKKFTGIGHSYGSAATASVTAYLETTDGELTADDFQEVADYGYNYFQAALKKAGFDTVAWSAITGTDMYREGKEEGDDEREQERKGGNWWTPVSARHGSMMYNRKQLGGFAFGKAKRAARLSEETGGAGAYLNLTVDFADIDVDVDVKTSGYRSTWSPGYNASYPVTKMSSKTTVRAMMKVAGNGGLSMLYNEKNVAEAANLTSDVPAEIDYTTEITEDAERAKKRRAMFSFSTKLESTPVVISTTRDKYKAAAKRALEKYADVWIEKIKESKA